MPLKIKPWWTIISKRRKYFEKAFCIEFAVVTQVKNIDHKCVYQILSNHFGIQGESSRGLLIVFNFGSVFLRCIENLFDLLCSLVAFWRNFFDALNLLSQFFILSLSTVSQLQRPTLFTSLRSFPVFTCILLVNNHCPEQKFFASPEKFHVLCF